jgi:hypothetical protein
VGVLLDLHVHKRILAALEELESVRAYDAARKPRAKAIGEVERKRK